VARILKDTIGDINQIDRAKKILSAVEEIKKEDSVTRFEVIDHRRHGSNVGRVFVSYDVSVKLVYQDDGKTLKVFVSDG
jgi:hypothetical protein